MLELAKYLRSFLTHKLYDKSLFEDFKKMTTTELIRWNNDFMDVLSKTVPFSDTWNNLIDVQKGYFNSWLALNANILSNLD